MFLNKLLHLRLIKKVRTLHYNNHIVKMVKAEKLKLTNKL